MTSRISTLCATLLAFVGFMACTPDEVGGPGDEGDIQIAGEDANSQLCTAGFFALVPGSGMTFGELDGLADDFNDEVIDATGLTSSDRAKLRRVNAYTSSGQVPPGDVETITVAKDSSGSGSGWCGDNSSGAINVSWCLSGGPTQPTAFQNRGTAILHELWNRMNSNTNKLSDWDAAEGCSLHAASDPTTTSPCVHEVQFEYDHCGVRSVPLTDDVDLFVGVSIDGPSSLEEDDDAQYTADFTTTQGGVVAEVVFGDDITTRPGPVGVEQVDGGAHVVLDPARTWTSSSHLDISSTSANPTTVTGEQAGSAWLKVTVNPAGNVVYPEPTATNGITVQEPPPPDPVVTTVEISPSSAVLGASGGPFPVDGLSVEMTGTAYDGSGNPMPGVSFSWSSTSQYATPIPATGESTLVVGCSPYPTYAFATITAIAAGTSVSGTASVTVLKNHPSQCL